MSIIPVLILSLVALAGVAAGAERRPSRSNRFGFRSPCGTADEVSMRGGQCMAPIFQLIEGQFERPEGDADVQQHCNRFNTTSRCVRQLSKDCLSGLHKTSVGAIASAMRRFYTDECKSVDSRAAYLEPLKCAATNGPAMKKLYQRYTGTMQGIRDLPGVPPEEKIVKMCCVLNEVDAEIAKIFDGNCPESRATVLKLVHAVTDDARHLLCENVRCKSALDMVRNHKYTPPQNFIEPIEQILFEINV